MTWRIHSNGTMEKITTHNWQLYQGDKLKCVGGNHRSDANCVGCGSIVTGQELVAIFGEETGQGLVAAEMADGITAGIFLDNPLAPMSH